MISDDFTADGYDKQTSRPGIRRNGGGHEQNRSLRTQNLLTAALFSALLIVGCSLLIVTADEADAYDYGDYYYNYDYTTSKTCVKITGYKGSATDVTIPSELNGYDVIAIGADAFRNNTTLENVTISSEYLDNIGNNAFMGCTGLKSVTISDSVTSIGTSAFSGCTSLESVTIGKVKKINDGLFSDCKKLKSIYIPDSVEEICALSVFSVTFYDTDDKKIITDSDKDTNYTRAEKLKGSLFEGIGDGELTKVDLTTKTIDGITYKLSTKGSEHTATVTGYVTAYMLSDKVTIPPTVEDNRTGTPVTYKVTGIGDNAFEDCTELTSLTINDSVTSIGTGAFTGCTDLATVTFGTGITGENISWGIGFYDADGKTELKNATDIKGNTFYKTPGGILAKPGKITLGYSNYTTKEITGVTTVTSTTYSSYTSGFISVTIGDGVTSIEANAFQNCTSLESVTISNTVTSIGSEAFSGCSGLTIINIPESVKVINDSTFQNCTSLATVTIEENQLTEVGDKAFQACSTVKFKNKSGTAIDITCSLTKIGSEAFSGCTGLTEATISDSVKSIGASTFSGCTGLTTVTIGNGVTSIGANAFQNCKSLKSVKIPDTVTTIGEYAFQNCTSLTSVTVPGSVGTIEKYTFDSCIALEIVVIGNGITTIGNHAFYGTTKLVTVVMSDTIASDGIKKSENVFNMIFKDVEGAEITEENYSEKLKGGTFLWDSGASALKKVVSVTVGDFTYTFSGTDATVTGCSESATDVTIPSKVENKGITYSVTAIGNSAFNGRTGLTKVTIPSTVTSIKGAAFSGCTSLATVTIEENQLTEVGDKAFQACSTVEFKNNSGTAVDITRSLIKIGSEAFSGCTKLTTVTIGNGVTAIGDKTFSGCTGLTTVTFGNGITAIASNAFDVTFKDTNDNTLDVNATNLKGKTFNGTGGTLKEHIPTVTRNGVVYTLSLVDETAAVSGYGGDLGNVTILSKVTYDDISTECTVTTVKKSAFKDCTSLTSVTIPSTVTGIGSEAFFGCSGLITVTIENGVTSIGAKAFQNCSKLETVTMPSTVTGIGSEAFCGCTKLKSINTLESVTVINDSTFQNCASLTSVTISDSVTSIGSKAFSGCTGLTGVTIGNNVTDIGESAFENCTGLTSVNFGSGVRTIGTNAFSGCTGLTTVTIPESVETIGNNAFTGCTGLTTLSIANGVTTIGENAFSGCTRITSVEIPNSVIDIKASAFNGCTSLTRALIGNHTATIGEKAFYGCPLTYLCIPASVTYIGASAFDPVIFHESDGTLITVLDAEHLKNSIFEGATSSEMRKTGSIVTMYTVTFKNWDGTIISSKEYAYGTPASAIVKPTATRGADSQYTYVFKEWSPSISDVAGDVTYTAQFTEISKASGSVVEDKSGTGSGLGADGPFLFMIFCIIAALMALAFVITKKRI